MRDAENLAPSDAVKDAPGNWMLLQENTVT